MTNDKQYLFPAGASHFLSLLLAVGFLGVSMYDLLSGQCAMLKEGNALMTALGVFLLLVYTSAIEACMMITTKGYLFAYNVDKAICVPIKNGDVKFAVSIGRKLYGPIFDKNCEEKFTSRPKSPLTRNFFYMAISLMFFMALIPPCCHLPNALHAWSWSTDLVLAWVFVFFDGLLIVNRIFYRTSIRRFWARTMGGDNFRAILDFELSNREDPAPLPYFVVIDDNDLRGGRIPGYTNHIPSKKRLLLTGTVLIILVVWVLNSRHNKSVQISHNNISTSRSEADGADSDQ